MGVDPDVLYLDHGQILTSAGTAAGIDLCLHIVRRDHGADVANRVARRMVVAPHRDGGQAQFIEQPVPSAGNGDPIGTAIAHALDHLDAAARRRRARPRGAPLATPVQPPLPRDHRHEPGAAG